MHALVPLVLAISGLPALLIGAWMSREPDARSRGMAVHWVLVGLAIQAGAVGVYWAGDDNGRVHAYGAGLDRQSHEHPVHGHAARAGIGFAAHPRADEQGGQA